MRRRFPGRFAPVAFSAAFRAAFSAVLGVAVAATAASGAAPTGASPAGPGAEPPACSVPSEVVEAVPSLPNLTAAIRNKKPVRIVVIGGASTKGAAAGAPENAYPSRLQVALQKQFPDVPITVVNQGMPRQTARQMVRRFPAEVSEDEPTLIIWEAGISDAVRGVDLDEFASALQAGIDLTKNRAIDLMLVDMQFSRKTTAVIDFDHYLDTIRRVGEMSSVYVFPRFAVMRNWSDENVFDYDDVPESERVRLAAQVYDCLGRALAEVIEKGVR
jgi:acyl-CoA thioesterase I